MLPLVLSLNILLRVSGILMNWKTYFAFREPYTDSCPRDQDVPVAPPTGVNSTALRPSPECV